MDDVAVPGVGGERMPFGYSVPDNTARVPMLFCSTEYVIGMSSATGSATSLLTHEASVAANNVAVKLCLNIL